MDSEVDRIRTIMADKDRSGAFETHPYLQVLWTIALILARMAERQEWEQRRKNP